MYIKALYGTILSFLTSHYISGWRHVPNATRLIVLQILISLVLERAHHIATVRDANVIVIVTDHRSLRTSTSML
jgi:hypothetical protein